MILKGITFIFRHAGKLVLFCTLLSASVSFGQWQEELSGNEWIDFSKKYARIEIFKSGLQRIKVADLPEELKNQQPANYQLWYRGKEVPVIKADTNEILFYGEVSDGASDSLVYRPRTARANPYVNLYSDAGVYFLTTAANPKKITTADGTQFTGAVEQFHIQKDIQTYREEYSQATRSASSILNQSFYVEANLWTTRRLAGLNAYSAISVDTSFYFNLKLENWYRNDLVKPQIEFLFSGLNTPEHNIYGMISPNKSQYRTFSNLRFVGYGNKKGKFTFENSDFSDQGEGFCKLVSVTDEFLDWFSLSYYVVEYPQLTDVTNISSKLFTFPYRNSPIRRIKITGTKASTQVINVTDPANPILIEGVRQSESIEFSASSGGNGELRIFAVEPEGYQTVAKANITRVNLDPVYSNRQSTGSANGPVAPGQYDYFILTTSALAEGAVQYAQYRASEEGGKYKVLVMDIRDVYDIYNYGEPSPIAIRNFVKFMLKGQSPEGKYLFLIGRSTSYPMRMVRELKGEVPTFGDPGSDNLLVSGLHGTHEDVMTIPVGRLSVFNNGQIRGYLEKVKSYEHERFDISWRKNVLHMSGGENSSEIQTLRSILSGLEPHVRDSEYAGKITHKVKTISSPTVERINISEEVNRGVGLLTFFGHGSHLVTDLDFGYVSDVSRGYANKGKYTVMYFNGCGVGNIFYNPSAFILSDDWIATADKGAVAIIANSYNSYVSSSAKHIRVLYEVMFEQEKSKPIGDILKQVAVRIVNEPGYNVYDMSNIHQVNLQGDPVLKLVTVDDPDYIVSEDNQSIFIVSPSEGQTLEQAGQGKAGVAIFNGGRYKPGQQVEVKVDFEYKNGTVIQKSFLINAIRNQDTLWIDIPNIMDLTRVVASVDPEEKIQEFTKVNNLTDLTFDWEVAKKEKFYPSEPIRDLLPPRFKVLFNHREIQNRSAIYADTPIELIIEDDRVLDIHGAQLEVYLYPCWDRNCVPQLVTIEEDWVSSVANNQLIIRYQGPPLSGGDYEIYFTGADKSGNRPVDGGYRIQFRMLTLAEDFDLLISPNPSSGSYMKFELTDIPPTFDSVTLQVYDVNGRLTASRDLHRSEGHFENVWYWDVQQVPSGIYILKTLIQLSDGRQISSPGKRLIVAH